MGCAWYESGRFREEKKVVLHKLAFYIWTDPTLIMALVDSQVSQDLTGVTIGADMRTVEVRFLHTLAQAQSFIDQNKEHMSPDLYSEHMKALADQPWVSWGSHPIPPVVRLTGFPAISVFTLIKEMIDGAKCNITNPGNDNHNVH